MNFISAFKQASQISRLATLERKRAINKEKRSKLKWQAQVLREEYEALVLEMTATKQADPSAQKVAPVGIESSEKVNGLG